MVKSKIIKKIISSVDTNREYSISEMTREQIFPWLKDRRSIRKAIRFDVEGPNILQVKIKGEGKGRDYKIKGKNIVKYLTLIGDAMVLTKKIHDKRNNTKKRSGVGARKRTEST